MLFSLLQSWRPESEISFSGLKSFNWAKVKMSAGLTQFAASKGRIFSLTSSSFGGCLYSLAGGSFLHPRSSSPQSFPSVITSPICDSDSSSFSLRTLVITFCPWWSSQSCERCYICKVCLPYKVTLPVSRDSDMDTRWRVGLGILQPSTGTDWLLQQLCPFNSWIRIDPDAVHHWGHHGLWESVLASGA